MEEGAGVHAMPDHSTETGNKTANWWFKGLVQPDLCVHVLSGWNKVVPGKKKEH